MANAVLVLGVYLVSASLSQVTAESRQIDWGPWTAWSVCSETCGYGTAYRIRQCHAKLRYGRACDGEAKQYQICKTRTCPSGTLDYRGRECAKNNHIYYGRRSYQWVPYLNKQEPCQLACKSKDYGYYARFKRTVADGVICNEENTAVCQQGECVSAGCDGVLGSTTSHDRCGKCNGDGSSCRLYTAIFTRTHLTHRGYNVVTTIPAGAASINVTEMRLSRNHLALSTLSGYFLNGNMRLQQTGEVKGAGTTFTYSRATGPHCPGECLTAPGPINESIRVELIYFRRNPGIVYSYTLPHGAPRPVGGAATSVSSHGTNQRAVQQRQEANKVSNVVSRQRSRAPAPAALTRRTTTNNNNDNNNNNIASSLPQSSARSSYQRATTNGGQSSYHRTAAAVKGSHGRYQSSRTQEASRQYVSRTRQTRRPVTLRPVTLRPVTLRPVTLRPSRRPPAIAKQPPRDIRPKQASGEGSRDVIARQPPREDSRRARPTVPDVPSRAVQKNNVVYQQGQQYYLKGDNGAIQYQHYYHTTEHDDVGDVPLAKAEPGGNQDNLARGQKPQQLSEYEDRRYAELRSSTEYQRRTPQAAPIPNTISASFSKGGAPARYQETKYDGSDNRVSSYTKAKRRSLYSWRISGFTECTEPCGGGLQDTRVVCIKSDTQFEVMEENCDVAQKPDPTTVVCNNQPCQADWVLGEWSDCSVSCGRGLQKRRAECKQRISKTLSITAVSASCPQPRPQSRQYCQRDPCHVWHTGNWTQCSSECGFGQRTRDVKCANSSGSEVEADLCRSQVKPGNEEICDMGSCAQGWFYTKWSKECSVDCGRGHFTRDVYCSAADGSRLAETKCGGNQKKPKSKKRCRIRRPCGGQWVSGPWSKCNATCGTDAFRTREILCVKNHGKNLHQLVKGHNCEKSKKPSNREPCADLPACEPQWYMTTWSECSKSCGTGVKTREVKCLDAAFSATPDCDKARKPSRRTSCNKHTCPDEIAEAERGAEENETFQMDGLSDSTRKIEGTVVPCVDEKSSGWCYIVGQARLCSTPYYMKLCCQTCRKMALKPR